jgi:hypothetical protein
LQCLLAGWSQDPDDGCPYIRESWNRFADSAKVVAVMSFLIMAVNISFERKQQQVARNLRKHLFPTDGSTPEFPVPDSAQHELCRWLFYVSEQIADKCVIPVATSGVLALVLSRDLSASSLLFNCNSMAYVAPAAALLVSALANPSPQVRAHVG